MLSPNLRAITFRICVSGTSVCPSSAAEAKAATTVGLVLAEGESFSTATAVFTFCDAVILYSSTSFFTTRPPSPVPCTFDISMPLSAASFFANGDAITRPVADAASMVEVISAAAISAGAISAGAASGAGGSMLSVSGAFGEVAALLAPDFSAATYALTSVPALPTMAIISLI